MHAVTRNELRLDFSITPVSPLSIQATTPPGFVRALHPSGVDDSAYIPGSTLKGVLRTAAAQVMREAELDCCDLEHPCTNRERVIKAQQAKDSAGLYRSLCGLCQMFGSKALRSHLTVTDCFPTEPIEALPIRDGDPNEVVLDEPFYGRLTLRNFERWQVGLLALLLTRINIAEVQLGGNRSAGMGCVSIQYRCLTVIYPGLAPEPDQQQALQSRLHGAGQLSGVSNPYGLLRSDVNDTADLPESAVFETGFGFSAVTISADERYANDSVEEKSQESDSADDTVGIVRAHGLIDNVLTRQVLAWGKYVRARKTPTG